MIIIKIRIKILISHLVPVYMISNILIQNLKNKLTMNR